MILSCLMTDAGTIIPFPLSCSIWALSISIRASSRASASGDFMMPACHL
jgi:hypothetical protein